MTHELFVAVLAHWKYMTHTCKQARKVVEGKSALSTGETFGSILEVYRKYIGSILEVYLKCIGSILEVYDTCKQGLWWKAKELSTGETFGSILEVYQKYIGSILEVY